MNRLQGKIALVTGAGRGIGRAVAEAFAREGATVVLVARTEADLLEVADEIAAKGGSASPAPGDVTDEAFVESLFEETRRRYGRLDILANCAGTAAFGPIEELPIERFRACLELNVTAAFHCMQRAIRWMQETGGTGKIINIGSVRSHWTEAGDGGAYNASKYALRGLTESVARQLHGAGSSIAVGMVCPGISDTSLTNPEREPRPEWLNPGTVAEAVLHAVTAPAGVNVFDTVVIPLTQRPW